LIEGAGRKKRKRVVKKLADERLLQTSKRWDRVRKNADAKRASGCISAWEKLKRNGVSIIGQSGEKKKYCQKNES